MAGNTATISVESFRSDWMTHMPIAALCQRYTISKDQVIRLRDIWKLPLRNDRRKRARRHNNVDPTPEEIAQRSLEVQSWWDDRTRHERSVTKPQPFTMQRIRLRDAGLDDLDINAFYEGGAETL